MRSQGLAKPLKRQTAKEHDHLAVWVLRASFQGRVARFIFRLQATAAFSSAASKP